MHYAEPWWSSNVRFNYRARTSLAIVRVETSSFHTPTRTRKRWKSPRREGLGKIDFIAFGPGELERRRAALIRAGSARAARQAAMCAASSRTPSVSAAGPGLQDDRRFDLEQLAVANCPVHARPARRAQRFRAELSCRTTNRTRFSAARARIASSSRGFRSRASDFSARSGEDVSPRRCAPARRPSGCR
jgi:hypothetical protein